MALCIVLGIVGGVLLDKLTGTLPLFTIVGTVLGSVAAFWGMYKMVLPVIYGAKRQDMNRKRKNR
ncbi:MAG: AtpZ/AtpI family protein [Chloroflexi bacterium]|nr:AtpZ/AtpI family protein [Chloroflexota bacterium]